MAQLVLLTQRRHQCHDDRHATLAQVFQVFRHSVFRHDRFVPQERGRIAANRADVAGQHIGGMEGRFGTVHVWCAGDRRQAAKRRFPQAIERGAGHAIKCGAAPDEWKVGQIEKHKRIGVAHLRAVLGEFVHQAAMIEARHDQDDLLGEDARLRSIGQHHRPALQAVAHAAAVDHGDFLRGGFQRCAEPMRSGFLAQPQL